MLTSRSRLPKLTNSGGYGDWFFKAKAHFGKTNKNIPLSSELPTQQKHLPRPAAELLQLQEVYQTALPVYEREMRMIQTAIDEENNPIPQEPEAPEVPSRTILEGLDAFTARKEEWQEHNKAIWEDIVESCEGEPLKIVKTTPCEDGRAAWTALAKRFAASGTTTMFMLLKEFLSLKQQNSPVVQYATEFKDLLRRLNEMDISFLEPITVVIFLQSLNSTFAPFVTFAMMNGTPTKISADTVIQDAIEFGKGVLKGEEADTSGVATTADGIY